MVVLCNLSSKCTISCTTTYSIHFLSYLINSRFTQILRAFILHDPHKVFILRILVSFTTTFIGNSHFLFSGYSILYSSQRYISLSYFCLSTFQSFFNIYKYILLSLNFTDRLVENLIFKSYLCFKNQTFSPVLYSNCFGTLKFLYLFCFCLIQFIFD